MIGNVLVDSSFYIDRLRTSRDPVEELSVRAKATRADLVTCGVVGIEVLRGLKHPKARQRLAAFLGCMIYVPTNNSLWEKATELAWQLDRKGRSMQVTDLIIAVCALEAGASVLTFDSDFERVPGLRVIDAL